MSVFAILAAASGASGLLLGETLGLGPQKKLLQLMIYILHSPY